MSSNLMVLAAIGLLFILKYGFIFEKPRNWLKGKSELLKELLSCSMCLGFWCGFGLALVNAALIGQGAFLSNIFHCVCFGFVVSLLGQLADILFDLVDETIGLLQKHNHGQHSAPNQR